MSFWGENKIVNVRTSMFISISGAEYFLNCLLTYFFSDVTLSASVVLLYPIRCILCYSSAALHAFHWFSKRENLYLPMYYKKTWQKYYIRKKTDNPKIEKYLCEDFFLVSF